jgi:hypothetical protein
MKSLPRCYERWPEALDHGPCRLPGRRASAVDTVGPVGGPAQSLFQLEHGEFETDGAERMVRQEEQRSPHPFSQSCLTEGLLSSILAGGRAGQSSGGPRRRARR